MLDFEGFKKKYQEAPVEEYPNRVVDTIREPVVSVHVSTYQHAEFISDCLDGALMQDTDFPVEILIGEDESTDGTREICKNYADRYPDKIRLFLHRRENNIQIHGRATGRFQSTYTRFKCRGKYIAVCEGDDYWTDPKKLQKQVEFLESYEECVLSYHPWITTYGKNDRENQEGLIRRAKKDGDVRYDPLQFTFVYENMYDEYPESGLQSMLGDVITRRRLSEYGSECLCRSVKPGIHREHNNNLYSSNEELDNKIVMADSLACALSVVKSHDNKEKIKKDIYHCIVAAIIYSVKKPLIVPESYKSIASLVGNIYQKGIFFDVIKNVLRMGTSKIVEKLATSETNKN